MKNTIYNSMQCYNIKFASVKSVVEYSLWYLGIWNILEIQKRTIWLFSSVEQ